MRGLYQKGKQPNEMINHEWFSATTTGLQAISTLPQRTFFPEDLHLFTCERRIMGQSGAIFPDQAICPNILRTKFCRGSESPFSGLWGSLSNFLSY